MGKVLELAGREFGRWKVLRISETKTHSNRMWECECQCGTKRSVIGSDLVQGKSKSCGCLSIEITSNINKTHGASGHYLYGTWKGMIARCYRKDQQGFKHYGGRGITVCSEWRDSPLDFIVWAKSHGHKKGLQIDRIDNDNGYSPENCRFVDVSTNLNNKRPFREGTSRLVGISKMIDGNAIFWRGVIYDKGKARWIKYFSTETDAAISRDTELAINYPHKKRDQMAIDLIK